MKKWAENMNRHFSKEDIQTANTHEKITKIIHCQENTNQNHNEIPPVTVAKINNSGNNRHWRECEERGILLHCLWECKLVQHCGKQCGGSSKN